MIDYTKSDLLRLAGQLAATLNRSGGQGLNTYNFQVVEESFQVLSCQDLPGGGRRIAFEFEGLVDHLGEPTAYLATGSVIVAADGSICPETLCF
ncbi:MAG: hypothetical protein AB1641_00165 [Thermodesulfobacteriota bacterium]